MDEDKVIKIRKKFRYNRLIIILLILFVVVLVVPWGSYGSIGSKLLKKITGSAVGPKDGISSTNNIDSSSETAAIVNGERITLAELNSDYDRIPLQQRTLFRKIDFLNQSLITTKMMMQEANKKNIKISDDEVKMVIDSLGESLPPGETVESVLNQQNIGMDEFERAIIERLIIEKLINQTIKVEVSDQEIKDFFDKNKDLFDKSESIRASHILVDSEEEAKEIKLRLKNGDNFSDLAKEFSKDPGSKDEGGDLNYFVRGQMIQEFEDAAFNLSIGEISDPVKTQFGYHIIMVTDKQPPKKANFDDVKDQIKSYVEQQKFSDEVQKFINEIRERSDIQIIYSEKE